jgi:hypothetical protein
MYWSGRSCLDRGITVFSERRWGDFLRATCSVNGHAKSVRATQNSCSSNSYALQEVNRFQNAIDKIGCVTN